MQMPIRRTIAPVEFRPGNGDLNAELHPAKTAFFSEENMRAVIKGMAIPPAVDGSTALKPNELDEIARQVYEMDDEGRAQESQAVGISGNDWGVLKGLLDKWNAVLVRRISQAWDTNFGPHVSYAFGWDMGSYLGDHPLWGEGKAGPYADGAGGFIDSRQVDYTANRRKGRPIPVDRYLDLSAQPPPDWAALM